MTDSCLYVEPVSGVREEIRYLDVGDSGGRVYLVHAHARGPVRGGVVLCGSINADREGALRTLVDFARTLATAGFDVLRFDYRGIGESTGNFAHYCFSDWRVDVEACVAELRRRRPGLPVGLWGMRAGALLASEVFLGGTGDAALLCAPMDAQAFLQAILRRSLVNDMTTRPHARRSTRAEIVSELERGGTVNVDGYPWTRRLWEDAASHRFVAPAGDARPWQVVDVSDSPRTPLSPEHEARRQVSSVGRFWEAAPTRVARDPSLLQITTSWLGSFAVQPALPAVASL